MLAAIRDFFKRNMDAEPGNTEAGNDRGARLAAAALLVEVARSDMDFSSTEREAILESVQRRFKLMPDETRELLTLAEAQSHDAHDLFQFTSQLNATFSPDRKAALLEELWRAAYHDGVLDRHEEHLIRRIAGLLHVPHSGFISAKLRAVAKQEQRQDPA